MVKIGFRSNGSVYDVNFDEQRIMQENNLIGSFNQTVIDQVEETPHQEGETKLYNYGMGKWFASGTQFGQVTAGARILFDPDRNNSQNGPHFTVQGLINVSGSSPYQIPVGDAHRIYARHIEIIFYDQDDTTISGTKNIIAPH